MKSYGLLWMPQHLIFLYCGQEATIKTEYGEAKWFPLGKSDRIGCIFISLMFNLYTEHVIKNKNKKLD